MTDKRDVRAKLRRLERVQTWQLVLVFILLCFISATFLRLNNVGMIERREAVFQADQSGDVLDLQRRLYDLQRYTAQHMNAEPGTIALEKTYQRTYEEELKKFEESRAASGNNTTVQKVRDHCDRQAAQGGWGRFWATADPRYVECINSEWEKYPAAAEQDVVFKAPSTEPYYHTFSSPIWSPDFAGWGLVITGVVGIIIIIRLVIDITLRMTLARKRRQELS